MKKLLFLLLAGICTFTAKAQHSYLSAPGVAVFYPAKYDVSAHAPSPIFEKELYPIGEVPTDWKITYSPWTTGESVSMKVVKDKTNALILKGLKFVEPEKKE